MISDAERKVLKQAAAIIEAQLRLGDSVAIPKFGKFYVSTATYSEKSPSAPAGQDAQKFVQRVARFRPFEELKSRLGIVGRTYL